MEFEEIKAKLVSMTGQTSLSDRSITDYVTQVMPKEGEPDEAFFASHSAILKSLSGNFNHDVATKIEEFKKSYTPPSDKVDNNNNQDQYKEILERMKALEEAQKAAPQNNPAVDKLQTQLEQLLNMETSRQLSAKADSLIAGLESSVTSEKLVINDKPTWDLAVDMVRGEIKAETTGSQLLEMVKNKYDQLFKRLNPSGSRQAFGSTEGGNNKSSVQSYLEKKLEIEKARIEQHEKFIKTLK
ncbi:MAG: hypothetical protein KBT03_11085 [Bacteroidales bacterium]|nr:hypothetical protein [Candidatus Scybalousia scybalohippi]